MIRIEEIRARLVARLGARLPEIEKATLARVYALSEHAEGDDAEYAHGLREAVSAALSYGIEALRRSDLAPPLIPAVLLAQARLAAHGGVSLDTVLRRYLAGYTLLGDYIIQEAGNAGVSGGAVLQRVLRAQSVLLDHLLAAIGEEYSRAQQGRLVSSEQRRADRIRRLLAGELFETTDLGYEFGGRHLGAIATGPGAADGLRELAISHNCRLLLIDRDDGAVWAWFGLERQFGSEEVRDAAAESWPAGRFLAFGEEGEGLSGWRLTHRQARAALPIACRSGEAVVRYADVALLASLLRDDLLFTSLHDLYLAPLAEQRDGGAVARATLRAYFASGHRISSAAAALGVNRHTVATRLRDIEERLARPIAGHAAEIDAALRLEDLESRYRPSATLREALLP